MWEKIGTKHLISQVIMSKRKIWTDYFTILATRARLFKTNNVIS